MATHSDSRTVVQRPVKGLNGGHASVPQIALGGSVWLPVGVAAALLAGAAALFWPTTRSLLAEWSDTRTLTYTHGHLVAVITFWLLFRRRAALRSAVCQPSFRAGAVLLALSIAWLIAFRAGLQLVHQMLLPLIGLVAIWTALGIQAARLCTFALGFLYFAIPLWSHGNMLLQEATVFAVRVLLQLGGISAYVVGNFVHIPAGTFEIAGGCSGLHFFIVALAIAALYGELGREPLKIRVALLALAALLSMVSNWLRVFIIIVAGHLSDMQHYLVKIDHYSFGWVVFAVTIVLFFAAARRFPAAPDSPPPAALATNGGSFNYAGAATALVAMTVGPLWALAGERGDAPAAAYSLPTDPGDWRGPFSARGQWQPYYPQADDEQHAEYRRASTVVSLYLASYLSQRQGKELIGYDNALLGKQPHTIEREQRLAYDGMPINELEVRDSSGTALVWHRYEIGSRTFVRGIAAQLHYALASLVMAPASQVVALRTPCVPDCAAARAALADFLQTWDRAGAGSARQDSN